MDLRGTIKEADMQQAQSLLNYQPFILSDDVQTGAAYSWLSGGDPRVSPPLVFHRETMSETEWQKASDLNQRLRAMYEDILDAASERFPGCSLLDVACNNGYFAVGAERRKMKGFGIDLGQQYAASIGFLNQCLGTRAQFKEGCWYDSRAHRFTTDLPQFDVTVMSAIMCHIPDPLEFLAAVAAKTRKAFIFWGQMIQSDEMAIAYNPPHPNLSLITDFPACFNDNTRLTRGLFDLSLRLLGFREVVPIPAKDSWLRELHGTPGLATAENMFINSPHVAFIAIR